MAMLSRPSKGKSVSSSSKKSKNKDRALKTKVADIPEKAVTVGASTVVPKKVEDLSINDAFCAPQPQIKQPSSLSLSPSVLDEKCLPSLSLEDAVEASPLSGREGVLVSDDVTDATVLQQQPLPSLLVATDDVSLVVSSPLAGREGLSVSDDVTEGTAFQPQPLYPLLESDESSLVPTELDEKAPPSYTELFSEDVSPKTFQSDCSADVSIDSESKSQCSILDDYVVLPSSKIPTKQAPLDEKSEGGLVLSIPEKSTKQLESVEPMCSKAVDFSKKMTKSEIQSVTEKEFLQFHPEKKALFLLRSFEKQGAFPDWIRSCLIELMETNPETLSILLNELSKGCSGVDSDGVMFKLRSFSLFHQQSRQFSKMCQVFATQAPEIIRFGLEQGHIHMETLDRNFGGTTAILNLYNEHSNILFSMIQDRLLPIKYLDSEKHKGDTVKTRVLTEHFAVLRSWVDDLILEPKCLDKLLFPIASQRPEVLDQWICDPKIKLEVTDLFLLNDGKEMYETLFECLLAKGRGMFYLKSWVEKGLVTPQTLNNYSRCDGTAMTFYVAIYEPSLLDNWVQSKEVKFKINDLEKVEYRTHSLKHLSWNNPEILNGWFNKGIISNNDMSKYKWNSGSVRPYKRVMIDS